MKASTIIIAVLRALGLVCLAVAVILVIASVFKWRADLLGEALVFYVARYLLVKTAADEEAYQKEQEASETDRN